MTSSFLARKPAFLLMLPVVILIASTRSVMAMDVGEIAKRLLLADAVPLREMGEEARPNVLFIIVDDLNLAIGAYQDVMSRRQYATSVTPNIDRLAAQGARFDSAYVQNPLCHPSRSSFLSGIRPATLGVYNSSADPRAKLGEGLRMLPEHFDDHGYFTARVGKVAHNTKEHIVDWDVSRHALSREPDSLIHFPGFLPGHDLSEVRDATWEGELPEGMSREDGMSRAEVLASVGRKMYGLPLTWRATHESPRMTPDGTTATRVIQLIAENRDKPFFIAAGFHKPHLPWVGPEQFFAQHPVGEVQLPVNVADALDGDLAKIYPVRDDDASLDERQHKQAIAAYHAMVTMMDSYVGELLDALEWLGVANSTIVVFTSDHGFHLNEHGGLWRKQSQFDESTRVPLLVRMPGQTSGNVVPGLGELVDLYPTLVDLAGLPLPAHQFEGTSFGPLLKNPGQPWKSAVFSESARLGADKKTVQGKTIRTEQYRYTEWAPFSRSGERGEVTVRELYDLVEDHLETVNLAENPSYAGKVQELSSRLEAGWKEAIPALDR